LSLLSDLQESVKVALKAGDKERVTALRMVVCELQKETKQARRELDESGEIVVLRRELKRRQESIEAFRAGAREDLASHEEYAAHLIESLLPKQMDEAELSDLVGRAVVETGASSAKDMGKVMAAVMRLGGVQVDGKLASRLVKERLSA
jgi:uncharacterized protein YqeY